MLEPALVSEIRIVHLIYTKYRAQQRGQRWWKYLAILHRRLLRFVQGNQVDSSSARFIVDKLAPPAARAFHTILAQGAFITLGFALLAGLARVRTLLLPYVPAKKVVPKVVSTGTDEDLGEAIDHPEHSLEKLERSKKKAKRSAEPGKLGKPGKSEKPGKQGNSGKSKKHGKSGRSAIDDIFS